MNQLDVASNLRVEVPSQFFLRVGQQCQLRVTRKSTGEDVTSAIAGTSYFVAVGDNSVAITPEGLLRVISGGVKVFL